MYCIIFTEVTLPHVCHILLIRSKQQVLPILKGERITQSCEYQEMGIIRDLLKIYLPPRVMVVAGRW